MADFEQAGATERLRRVAILREMQAKLKRSHAEALGIAPGAAPHEVRSAFMELTKQYHPAKFARLDEATVKLANEVFLELREAYELMATAGNKRARTTQGVGPSDEAARKPEAAGQASGSGQGVRVPDRAGTAAGIGAPVRVPDRYDRDRNPGASAGSAAPAANTNATNITTNASSPGARRPLIGGPRATTAPATSASPAGAPPTRPSSPSLSGAARPGGSGTVVGAGSAGSASGSSSGSAAAAAAGPPTRPSAPSISTSASTSMSGRPSAVPAAGSGKVVAPQPPAAASSASSTSGAGGPAIRFGAAPSASGAPSSAAPSSNHAELVRIRGLISRQKWTEARDALQLLLQRAPTDRGSMAQLAYVRGREALELGNVSEARRELLRALAIEPAMEAARATLRELNDVTPSSNPSAPRR